MPSQRNATRQGDAARDESQALISERVLVELDADKYAAPSDERTAKIVEIDGECYVVFPDGLCEKQGWNIGDTLILKAVHGALLIEKKGDNPL